MIGPRHKTQPRGRLSVRVAITLLAVTGSVLVAVAVTQQGGPPRPPLASPSVTAAGGGSGAVSAPKVVGLVMAPSVPVAIDIPAIKVRSAVQLLGQTASGALAVPAAGPHYDEVGWYRYSPTPGSLGPAVMVGHVDSAAHGPSIFWRLGSLRPGDQIVITRSDGTLATFAVDSVARYAKTAFPTQLVYGNTDDAALRLLTCGGPIVGGHYRDNVVVLAHLVRAAPAEVHG